MTRLVPDLSAVVAGQIRESLTRRAHERVGPFIAAFDLYSADLGRNYAIPDNDADPSRDEVEQLAELFHRKDRVPRLEYVPALARAVEPALVAAGFTIEGRPPVMASTPETALAGREPADVRVELPTDDSRLLAAARVQHAAYGSATPAGSHDVARLRAMLDRGGLLAIAVEVTTSTVVGSGLVDRNSRGDTVGELAAVGVLAEYRRRGIASAISVVLATVAHTHGMDLVWLEAAPEEESIYRRAGFVDVANKLWISRP